MERSGREQTCFSSLKKLTSDTMSLVRKISGGDDRIRTCEGLLTLNGLANRRLQPLGHISVPHEAKPHSNRESPIVKEWLVLGSVLPIFGFKSVFPLVAEHKLFRWPRCCRIGSRMRQPLAHVAHDL